MKLSDYAKQQGVRYETAWRWFRDGKIKGHRGSTPSLKLIRICNLKQSGSVLKVGRGVPAALSYAISSLRLLTFTLNEY